METHYRKLSWSENLASLNTTYATIKSFNSEKLQAINERIMANAQLQIMKNRVKQLAKAKELAQLDIHQAELKAKEIRKRMKRKEQELMKKAELLKQQKAFEEKQRKRFNKERMQRHNKIKKFERKIVRCNKNYADEYKEKRRKWDDLIRNEKLQFIEEKAVKRRSISQGYVEALKIRCISQRNYRESLKEEYVSSIQSEREVQAKAVQEIKELEKAENMLLEELSKTLEMRSSCFESLNKLRAT